MTNGCLNTALLLQRLQLLHPLFVLGTKHSVVTYVPVCFYKVSISGLLCTNMLLHIERKSVFQYRMFITQRIFLTLTYFGKIDCFWFSVAFTVHGFDRSFRCIVSLFASSSAENKTHTHE